MTYNYAIPPALETSGEIPSGISDTGRGFPLHKDILLVRTDLPVIDVIGREIDSPKPYEIDLAVTHARLLGILASAPNVVVSFERLFELGSVEQPFDAPSISVHPLTHGNIHRLIRATRAKLRDDIFSAIDHEIDPSQLIEHIEKIGYRLNVE